MRSRRLEVCLYDTVIAHLFEPDLTWVWTSQATERWGAGSPALSHSLPVGQTPSVAAVSSFINNLLPEQRWRKMAASAHGVEVTDTFSLLEVLGQDVPGAVTFSAPGAPTSGTYVPVSSVELAAKIQQLGTGEPVPTYALPGMVPKMGVHREAGQWFLCNPGAPSTWVIKKQEAPSKKAHDSIDTEAVCLTLAKQTGLTIVACEILDFPSVRALAVSRFDRSPAVHQTSLAQALKLNAFSPKAKFQYANVSPSFKDAAHFVPNDRKQLLRVATFSFLMGNTDLHAKNLAFVHDVTGRVSVAPVYDVTMRLHHTKPNKVFALRYNNKQAVEEVTLGDVVEEGVSWGLSKEEARHVVYSFRSQLAECFFDIDRSVYPRVLPPAWDAVAFRLE